jgi:hypothetical protein
MKEDWQEAINLPIIRENIFVMTFIKDLEGETKQVNMSKKSWF